MECSCFYITLILGFFIHSLSTSNIEEESICGEEILNAEKGEISLSEFFLPGNFSCRWTLSAAPRKKLLLNIQSVHLIGDNESLLLNVDGVEHLLIRECENCMEKLPSWFGEVITITYSSRNSFNDTDYSFDNTLNETDSSSFIISYSSFDPLKCPSPKVPQNGFYVGKNWTKNSKIYYKCNVPYELSGKDKSTCIVVEDSPVPVWENDPPKCVIPSCHNQIINRTAGKGVIVHPGYPAKTVLSSQHCRWNIVTEKNRRIAVKIKNFSLPLAKGKHNNNKVSTNFVDFYDDTTDNLMLHLQGQSSSKTLTTDSNRMIIILNVGNASIKSNDAGGNYGFNIEYAATCPILTSPLHGSFENYSLSVGSNVTIKCLKGFYLDGERSIHCLPNASWSSPLPTCKSQVTMVEDDFISSEPSVNIKILPKFISKGNKKTEVLHQSASEKERVDKVSKTEKEANTELSFSTTTSQPLLTQEEQSARNDDTFMIVVIVCGIVVPIVLLIGCFSVCFWYRKRYPARMGFGRKFETFENPAYQKRKRINTSIDPTENPAELQRLTKLTSP